MIQSKKLILLRIKEVMQIVFLFNLFAKLRNKKNKKARYEEKMY